MVTSRLERNSTCYVHAPYLVRRWLKTVSGSTEKTESHDEGSCKKKSSDVVGCWGNLPYFRQPMGKPGASSSKEGWNDCYKN